MSKSSLGVFDPSRGIILRRYPNGGWVIIQPTQEYAQAEELGAYTTAIEMLDALSAALLPNNKGVES